MRMAQAARGAFDVLIVGGGIIGAGISRDAAQRGLRVALLEQADFASGTTAGSTRLIHGGLRYLEQLDWRLVRLDLREREALLRIAPHLVRPLEFLLPVYGRGFWHRARLKAGMLLYDLLSYDKSLPSHRWLPADEAAREEPGLTTESLRGAACYYDAQVELPERLCLENLIEAQEHGATVLNYAEVIGPLRAGGRLAGLQVRDVLTGEQVDVQGRVIVNAAGPWLDRLSQRLLSTAGPRLRTTKGIHVICPPLTRRAVVLFSPIDGRLLFAIPWLGYTLLGTTDTDYAGEPRLARASAADVDYLVRSLAPFLPGLDPARILFSQSGVRALVLHGGTASGVSRQHRLVDESRSGLPGLLSVVGGKITGYRAIAEEATDLVCRRLGVASRCRTAVTPLPGARPHAEPPRPTGVTAAAHEHVRGLYGARASAVLDLAAADPALAEPLASGVADIGAQVVFAVRAEHSLRIADVLLRRTRLGFGPDQGRSVLPRVAALMARELNWDTARRSAEERICLAELAGLQAFRSDPAGRAPHAAPDPTKDPRRPDIEWTFSEEARP